MLYIFDLDGTLVKTYGTALLPNAASTLERLSSTGENIAVATNQAGLAWRIATRDDKFPDVTRLASRFLHIAQHLPVLQSVPWFVSLFDERITLRTSQYDNLVHELTSACGELNLHAQATAEWRKPQPGMLLAAASTYQVLAGESIFVGDYTSDADAAAAAGMDFQWADDFFKR